MHVRRQGEPQQQHKWCFRDLCRCLFAGAPASQQQQDTKALLPTIPEAVPASQPITLPLQRSSISRTVRFYTPLPAATCLRALCAYFLP
jgi:hypothetical protein